jgi:hypothetical protein
VGSAGCWMCAKPVSVDFLGLWDSHELYILSLCFDVLELWPRVGRSMGDGMEEDGRVRVRRWNSHEKGPTSFRKSALGVTGSTGCTGSSRGCVF